jgi:tricarballylate dehydrogenase
MASPARSYDVVVVGAGNAALCAALSAREAGRSVAVLERAPKRKHGGNSRFTMAAMRFAYDGLEDLREVARIDEAAAGHTDFGEYPASRFLQDLDRVSGGRCDAALAEAVVGDSRGVLRWLGRQGVDFVPLYDDQAFEVDGKRRFWGGLTLQARGGGPGLVRAERRAVCKAGIPVHHETRARRLHMTGGRVVGVEVVGPDGRELIGAGAVVLACGGFEADAAWRRQHLGGQWSLAKVRGTRFNTGDGLRMAFEVGAREAGDWSGCHAVQWDRGAPDFGDLQVRHAFQKHSYPLGLLVNAEGRRFVDEGADFRNYTYARYGAAVLEQPGRFAWQVFDSRVTGLLRSEYHQPHATRVTAASLEELADRLEGVDAEAFLATVGDYNRAVDESTAFDPSRKDGRRTRGLTIEKSNWANRLDAAPFEAWAVTCGITFTFGGLAIAPDASVLGARGRSVEGLFAAGELVGGLFWGNYPGGAGLTAGAVFGRRAGSSAAAYLDAR